MKTKILKNTKWSVLISSVILLVIGLIALFSATKNSEYEEFYKQLMWIGISIPVFIATVLIGHKRLIKASYLLYIIILFALVGVLFTPEINGAHSWISIGSFSIQPSEFAKIIFILALSKLISNIQKEREEDINKIKNLIKVIGLLLVPTVLIAMQPDYGTAIAFFVATAFMLFAAKIDKKYIMLVIVLIIVIVPLLYFTVLPEHAKARISIYLDPYKDPRGAGYNVIQSMLAIGAGQLFGMGLFKGNQTQLGYLYPKSTDFIYAVIGEEMGFVVAAGVIILYLVLILGMIDIAKKAQDTSDSYIATGIVGIFVFHMLENIGMTMGLLPITGVPLLFVSYGGSSLLTSVILVAILISISMR